MLLSENRYRDSGISPEPGDAVQILRSVALDQAAQDAHFAVLQSNVVLDFVLADDRLLDSADVARAGNLRDVDGQLHADVAVRMHPRRDVDIHADVDVLKLRVDQGVDDARAAADAHSHARLKAAGRDRHALADFERTPSRRR